MRRAWLLVVVCGVLVRTSRSDQPAAGPPAPPGSATPGQGKTCPTCRRSFSAGERYCPIDGIPLTDAPAAAPIARVCPQCGRSYQAPTRYCALDGAPLRDASTDRAAPIATPNQPIAAPAVSSVAPGSVRTPDHSKDRPEASSDTHRYRADLAGSAMLGAWRSARFASPADREAWQARADAAAKRFEPQWRTLVAILADGNDMDQATRPAQSPSPVQTVRTDRFVQQFREALERAELPDLQFVSPSAMAMVPDARQVTLRLRIWSETGSRSGVAGVESESPQRSEDALRLGARGLDPRHPHASGTREVNQDQILSPELAGPTLRVALRYDSPTLHVSDWTTDSVESATPRDTTAACQLAALAARRLRWLPYDFFERGRQFVARGQPHRATEEFIKFLLGSADFETPQANEANRCIEQQLGVSLLDWLWGDRGRAFGSVVPGRRLPLGFRPVVGAGMDGDLPRAIVSLRDGAELVLVRGGRGPMGGDVAGDAAPTHTVVLPPFYIDRYEVCCDQYERFVAVTGHSAPPSSHWQGRHVGDSNRQLPVTDVTWFDAAAYAQWAGKTLPSEAQWERAARGTDACDDSDDDGRTADTAAQPATRRPTGITRPAKLLSVFSSPAALSPYGCQNLLGNAAEWCYDWYAPGYESGETTAPLGPAQGSERVIRGGAPDLATEPVLLPAAVRARAAPSTRFPHVGFRCVLNLTQD